MGNRSAPTRSSPSWAQAEWARSIAPRDTKLERDVAHQGAARGVRAATPIGSRGSSAKRKPRGAQSSEHRADLRPRRVSASALVMELVDGRRWPSASRPARCRWTKRCRSRGRSPTRSSRARAGHRPSRSEAGERQGHARRRGEGLDFGLAKALAPDGTRTATRSNSPTLTRPRRAARNDPRHCRLHVSGAGARQARRSGAPTLGVRRRAVRDALPAAARSPATRVSDVLASVLKDTVRRSIICPRTSPPCRRRLLRRCLEKDPPIGGTRLVTAARSRSTTRKGRRLHAGRHRAGGRAEPGRFGVAVVAALAAAQWPPE